MEDNKKSYEGRRDYGQSSEKKFSAEGRVLRPRKKVSSSNYGEHKSFGEDRPHGERKSYGDRKPYGERKSYGERSSFSGNGEGRQYGERKSYGDRKPYGERSSFSGNSEGRQYGERKSYGDRKPYGERSSFSGNGEGRQYGERKSYGDRKPFGERKSYGDRKPYGERSSFSGNGEGRQYGERKSYGDRKPYGNNRGAGKPYGQRKQFGGRGGNFKKDYEFNDERGINKMLSRKPQLDSAQFEGQTFTAAPAKDEVRLNKFIANSGVCSRREADTLIQAGVVTVNGEVVTELGTRINIYNDDVRFNGERLKGEEKVYIVMNKPKGYVTTASDPHAERTVIELLKGCEARVFPVGRLDKATTGVLMFTNDGEIAEKLTHPSFDKKKIYQVQLDHALAQEDYDKILNGITLPDGDIKADELEYIDENDKRKLGIEIHSGKNRIVRRIFDSLGYEVKALDRVYFAGLTKKGLKKGEWRYLTEGEVNILKMGAYM